MDLFNLGAFILHSGDNSTWKIDCDALTNKDVEALAWLIAQKIEFSKVAGVPSGGVRLAKALDKYTQNTGSTLLVDDVLTTGDSIVEYSKKFKGDNLMGIVLFSRGKCPYWVIPVFELNINFRDIQD